MMYLRDNVDQGDNYNLHIISVNSLISCKKSYKCSLDESR